MDALLIDRGDPAAPSWTSPGRGLWVASSRTGYLGMIERIDGRYLVTDGHGKSVGAYDALGDAQESIDHWVADGSGDATRAALLTMGAIVALLGASAIALTSMVLLT